MNRDAAGQPPAHVLFLVASVSHATKGEAALIRAGIACRLIPVPRALSSQCGVCLRVQLGDREAAAAELTAAAVRISAVCDLDAPHTSMSRDQKGGRE